MVPMLTCGLFRSNFAFATGVLLWTDYVVRRTTRLGQGLRSGLFARGLRTVRCSAQGSLRSSLRCDAHSPVAFALLAGSAHGSLRSSLRCDAHSPVAFAMISFATFPGTSA